MFTAVFAVIIAFAGLPYPNGTIKDANLAMAFIFPLPSLYVLSYLFTLSARGTGATSHGRSAGATPITSLAHIDPNPTRKGVGISQTTEVKTEGPAFPCFSKGYGGEKRTADPLQLMFGDEELGIPDERRSSGTFELEEFKAEE